jgi:hypothetical protein
LSNKNENRYSVILSIFFFEEPAQSLDAMGNYLVALIHTRTCIAALSRVHAHDSNEPSCEKTDSKSVFREPGSGALPA